MHLCRFDVTWCLSFDIPNEGLSTRKQNIGEAILQKPSSLCPTSHDEVTNTEKKTNTEFPSGK